jgi:hypothetical protein
MLYFVHALFITWSVLFLTLRNSCALLFPGEDDGLFTVEVHNGFFCGLRDNLCYVDSSTAHFDNCTADTWSISWVNEILRILGCERDGRLHVYWLLPGHDIRNGLVLVENQANIRQMVNASKTEKTLVLFTDRTNFLLGHGTIMAAAEGHGTAESSHSSSMFEADNDGKHNADSDGSDSDYDAFELYDSDFDVEEGDDDLFADNVDKSVSDNNEMELREENEDEDALEDDDLNLAPEARQHLKKSIKAFNPDVDMDNPTFKLGMLFSGVEE